MTVQNIIAAYTVSAEAGNQAYNMAPREVQVAFESLT